MVMKKAQFFTMDAVLAVSIILVTIVLMSSEYISERDESNIYFLSNDIMDVYSNLKVKDSINDYVKSLIANGSIVNINNTILEQIGEFWSENRSGLASRFVVNITRDHIRDIFGFSVLVDEEVIYADNKSINNQLISSKRIISGITSDNVDKTIPKLWGPAVIEVRVWE